MAHNGEKNSKLPQSGQAVAEQANPLLGRVLADEQHLAQGNGDVFGWQHRHAFEQLLGAF